MTTFVLILVVLLWEIVGLFLSLEQRKPAPFILFSLVSVFMAISTTGHFSFIIFSSPLFFIIAFISSLPLKRRKFAPGLIWAIFLLAGFYSAWYGILIFDAISVADLLQDAVLICGLLLIPSVYLSLRAGLVSRSTIFNFIVYSGLALTMYCWTASLFALGPTGFFFERIGLAGGYNPNLLASFLDLSVPLALWRAWVGGRNRLHWAVFGTQFLGLLMTGTRGSFPTIAVSIGVILWGVRRSPRALAFSILLIVGVVFAFASVAMGRLFHPSLEELASNWDRLKLAEASRNVLKKNDFFWGIGFNTFYKVKYHFGFPYWGDQGSGFSSHDAHMEIYLGWGLLGILGWLGMIFQQLIKHALRWWGRKVYNRSAAIGIGLGCFMVHGIVESTIGHPPFVWMLSLLLALSFFQMEGDKTVTQ